MTLRNIQTIRPIISITRPEAAPKRSVVKYQRAAVLVDGFVGACETEVVWVAGVGVAWGLADGTGLGRFVCHFLCVDCGLGC